MSWVDEITKPLKKAGSVIMNGGTNTPTSGSVTRVAESKRKTETKDAALEKVEFDKFKAQNLLDANSEDDLYIPTYKRSPQLQKEQEGMLSLFNARRDDILSRQRTPGMSQTRLS